MTKRKRPRSGQWLFDESSKRITAELSEAKALVSAAAVELELDVGRISKWRKFNKHDFQEKVEGLPEQQK